MKKFVTRKIACAIIKDLHVNYDMLIEDGYTPEHAMLSARSNICS